MFRLLTTQGMKWIAKASPMTKTVNAIALTPNPNVVAMRLYTQGQPSANARQKFGTRRTLSTPLQGRRHQQQQRRFFHDHHNVSALTEPNLSPAEDIMLDATAWFVAFALCWSPSRDFDDLDVQNVSDLHAEADRKRQQQRQQHPRRRLRQEQRQQKNVPPPSGDEKGSSQTDEASHQ